jgi:predicted Zn-dependent peptidase
MQSNVAKRTGEIREVHEDRVPQSRIYMVWNVPEWGSRDSYILDLISSTLAEGKNSRLYNRLVYDEQIATGVLVDYWKMEIAGFFSIEVDVKPGVENTMVEKAVREELAKLLNEEISEKEL